MDSNCPETEWQEMSCDRWTESHVSSWLRFIGIEETYITKLKKKVTGAALKTLQREFLSNTVEMTTVQIEHLLRKRDELLESEQESNLSSQETCDAEEKGSISTACSDSLTSSGEVLSFCEFCKFDQNEKDCRYVKHNLLPPETGSDNMLVPCHEFKSLENAHEKDSEILKLKVATEVLKFACACMNMRANGTIHFGIMDKVKGTHKHGEIIGIPVKRREDFVDALDYIERYFEGSDQQSHARCCIRNPRFIEVLDKETTEKTWVIEYDIVPKATIVKDEIYYIRVPKVNEKDKVKYEEKIFYCRVGANTKQIPYKDLAKFIKGLKRKDQQRQEAEASSNETPQDFSEDQKRKLLILLKCKKGHMDNSLYYIVVTNKIQPERLDSIDFLVNMNLFCVFDFDPDSLTSGLCGTFKKQKAANLHFLKDYANEKRLKISDFIKSLQLFEKTSWIFCNGRNDFPGGEQTCDEKTWIRTKQKKLKKAVSVICNDILPRGSFVVLFLLTSDVEQPLVETFHEFYTEMNGHDFLTVLSESKENSKKFSSLAQLWCPTSTLKDISVEMPLSHVNATVQSIQLSKNQPTRTLPVVSGGRCFIKSVEEATLDSLEIISVDQCNETKLENMTEEEIQQTDIYFYQGGKIDWINFWLADKHKCGDIIKRDAYNEAITILDSIIPKARRPVESVSIYHHPGSGGSTVARQILWDRRKKVRCAVVKQGKEITTVCEHAVKLREHDENDKNNCLPVLLLLDNHNADYIDELRIQLGNVIVTKKINPSVLCFILLICNRSNNPERLCRASPSQTVAVTHKLSDEEKPLFSKKLDKLRLVKKTEFTLTFVLMSDEFESSYIENFVRNLLDKTDHSSPTTRLIRFVALLNSYVDDSYISVSHCEAFLGIRVFVNNARYHAFVENLPEEAKLILIHLRQSSTHIQSIKIIHPRVAKELLRQLPANVSQSDIAMDLITDEVLVNHRFDQDTFLKFIKDLFIRRNKSRGDLADTAFSPFIEHVTKECGVEKAVDLMEAAFIALRNDAYVAQQLAQLLDKNDSFKDALEWAEHAQSLLPHDISVLDTLGKVHERYFDHSFDSHGQEEPSPKMATEIISISLKGMSAFRASAKTPTKENATINNSYYREVDIGCRLLKFLSVVDVFSNNAGKLELMRYLLTEYIPAAVDTPWQDFHQELKGLHKNLSNALECISEDLSYFQTDISEEDEELDARDPEQLYNPRKWLTRKSAEYAGLFCNILEESDETVESNSDDMVSTAEKLSAFQKQMRIHELGGGNVTSILNKHYDKKPQDPGCKLETIINMYQEHQTWKNLDQVELTKFIFCQITLNCILPGSSKLLSLQELQDLSKRFITRRRNVSSASALFVLSLLFWPETSNELSSSDAKILSSAIDQLQKLWERKVQHMTPRKRRTVTHFYLAKPRGLNKIVHKSAIEKHIKGTLNDRQLKWRRGEVWKTKEVMQRLKRVEGWTDNRKLFVTVGDRRIRVFPQYSASLPNENENVTFYLGFSFDGVVAFDIEVTE